MSPICPDQISPASTSPHSPPRRLPLSPHSLKAPRWEGGGSSGASLSSWHTWLGRTAK